MPPEGLVKTSFGAAEQMAEQVPDKEVRNDWDSVCKMVQTINTECSGGMRSVDRMTKLLYLLDTSLVGQRSKGCALWWYNEMMQTCNRTDMA